MTALHQTSASVGDEPDMLDLATALDEFAARAFLNPAVRDAYVARQGIPSSVPLILTRIRWTWANRWVFAGEGEGERAVVIVVSEEVDGDVEAIDLLAWPLSDPVRFGLMFGAAMGLNIHAVDHAGTYVWNEPVRVFRTPAAWARDGARGVVVFHDHDLPLILGRAHGRIQAEDRDHALHLARVACRSPFLTPDRIVFARGVA